MAHPSICGVDGCDKAAEKRGWCSMHYRRWLRHGDPTGGRTPNGEQLAYIEALLASPAGEGCVLWPYSRNAHGQAIINNRKGTNYVARIVCERVHGAPTDGMDTAHSCGKGHLGCISPSHVSWKSHAGNMADMVEHGTSPKGERHGMAKLSEADVRRIRELKGVRLQREIAATYAITPSMVSMIHGGKSWGWLV